MERVSLLLRASMYILQDLLSVTAPEVCNASVRELIQTQAQCERNVTGKYDFFRNYSIIFPLLNTGKVCNKWIASIRSVKKKRTLNDSTIGS